MQKVILTKFNNESIMMFDSNINYWNDISMLKLKFNVYSNHPLIVVPQTIISYKQRCFKATYWVEHCSANTTWGVHIKQTLPQVQIFSDSIAFQCFERSTRVIDASVLDSNEWVFGLFNCVMELANYEQLRNTCIFHCIILPRQSIIPTDLSSSPNIPTVEDQWGWIPLIVATFTCPTLFDTLQH